MKTRLLLSTLIAAIIFSACSSTKRLIVKGKYDKAIEIATKRIHKKPTNTKEIQNLKKAYAIANQKDNDQVSYLKKSGQPEIWDEVYIIYSRMDARQSKVKTLPSNILRQINYKEVNYDQEIITAKKKAAEYYYVHGKQMLNSNDKFKARDAYYEFQRIKDLFASYKDVDDLINQAYSQGQTFVKFKVTNILNIPLPKPVQQELDKMSLGELDEFWIKYQTANKPNGYYDYEVNLQINYFNADRAKEETDSYVETKQIEDGWDLRRDEMGRVTPDSVKVKKYKNISCTVKEVRQFKSASITGAMEMYDKNLNRMIKTVPVKGEAIFENFYAEAYGDLNALKTETKKKIGGKRQPFPTAVELLMQSFDILKQVTLQAIKDNKELIQ